MSTEYEDQTIPELIATEQQAGITFSLEEHATQPDVQLLISVSPPDKWHQRDARQMVKHRVCQRQERRGHEVVAREKYREHDQVTSFHPTLCPQVRAAYDSEDEHDIVDAEIDRAGAWGRENSHVAVRKPNDR